MRDLLRNITRNPLGMVGALLTTVSAILILTIVGVGFLGFRGGPYLGIIAFLILPGLFVLGLVLIPLGGWLERRRARRAAERGEAVVPLPVIDLNEPRTRGRVLLVLALTAVNVVIVALAFYKGVQVMDSARFCGSCHSVMDPEFTAYERSPHARVQCVECHIGPGANWFVKSKLSGVWQVVSVNLKLYPRPIPVPVHDLRPARETCEECHWPTKFVGDRLRIITRHDDDEKSTVRKTVLLLHVGGRRAGRSSGIHWHVESGVRIRFVGDPARTRISFVELTRPDGTRRVYRSKDAPPEPAPDDGWRVMDCVDCHNRPTHVFRSPEDEVDAALEEGRIDPTLPYARREAVKALKGATGTHAEAAGTIRNALVQFYSRLDPAGFPAWKAAVGAAAVELGRLYAYDVWPSMNIGWGTYPSFLGHDAAPGCWRCHDDAHASDDGKVISQDCTSCHAILAQDERQPKILDELGE